MKATERNDLIRKYFAEDLALMIAKGHDYSGDEDCLSNLRNFGKYGIVLRIDEKFQRIKNFLKARKLAVSNESALDSLRDIRNFCYLLQIFMEGKEVEPDTPLFIPGTSDEDGGAGGVTDYARGRERKP